MIKITDNALNYLNKYTEGKDYIFEFTSDKVGCTCSEESIVSLKITTAPDKDATATISSNIGEFYMTPKQKMLLNDDLTIDFKQNLHALELKGDHIGLINPRMQVYNEL